MEQHRRLEISSAIMSELEKMPKWKVMSYLQQNGETSAYKMAKDLGWTTGKVHSLIRGLEASSAIESKVRLINGRAVKLARLKD